MPIFEQSTTEVESPDASGQEEMEADVEGQETESADYEAENESGEEPTAEGNEDQSEEDAPPQDGQGQDLILGKFKSQDDLVKAYQNLERQFTQSRQQPQQPNQMQQPSQQPQQPADYNEMFWERFRDNPIATMQSMVDVMVNQRTAPIVEQRQNEVLARNIDAVARDFQQIQTDEGMGQLFARVNEIAQEFGNPNLARNPSQRVLRMAAQELFGDSTAKVYEKAKQAGRAEAEQSRRAKQGVAVTTSQKPQERPKTPEEMIRDSIMNAGARRGIFG